jgi:hypothetical protein
MLRVRSATLENRPLSEHRISDDFLWKWRKYALFAVAMVVVMVVGCAFSGALQADVASTLGGASPFLLFGLFCWAYTWVVAPAQLSTYEWGFVHRTRLRSTVVEWERVVDVTASRQQQKLSYMFLPIVEDEAFRVRIYAKRPSRTVRLHEGYENLGSLVRIVQQKQSRTAAPKSKKARIL